MDAPGYHLRPATARDARAIRRLIRQVRINPLDLDWHRFILAEDQSGRLVGCGQIKPHRDGSRELASIAITPAWRGRGAARAIIERLLAAEDGPLYLTARDHLQKFYERFGFHTITWEDGPPYYRRINRLRRMGLVPKSVLLMERK